LEIEDWKLKIGNLEFRTPNFSLRTSAGFSYIALLVAIVIIGISLGAAGKYWQNVMLREKEEELFFRGDQYRKAIERYFKAVPGRPQYPRNIDDLLVDNRTPAGKRHLRQKFKDPMTGEDFEIITAQTATAGVRIALGTTVVPGIIGVHSKSEKEPLKKDNFPPGYQDLAGKSKYNEWLFVAFTGTAQPAIPGQTPFGIQPQAPGQAQIPGQTQMSEQPQEGSGGPLRGRIRPPRPPSGN
jgi:type II secretory pathway pseudopilin PulG